jgi:ribosome recycling factor
MIDNQKVQARMGKIVNLFLNDIQSVRTGRATPGLIENVVVTVYSGQKMRLIEIGTILAADARTLTFQPWDQSIIREVANGIMAAMLTTEQRDDYVKLLGRKLEGVRVLIRDARADFRKGLQKAKQDKTISEDEYRNDEDNLQKMADEYIEKLEEIAKKKEIEIRG